MISLQGVSKQFSNATRPAVDNLSLEIDKGEMVVLVGPSGCGKTTTMKMINRLVEPTSGKIFVDGVNVLDQDPVMLRRGIGYVIQNIGLMPHRTVGENMGTVARLVGWEQNAVAARVAELAEILNLSPELLDRYPAELSGGQRQRVGVARALAVDPPVMLMDEPFGAVDPIIRARLQDQFLDLQARLSKTVVFVTHDIDEAIKMADRIAILNVGGVLEQFTPPEQILRDPASDFVREFVGSERGLKRLALIKVGDIEIETGPVIGPSASFDEALRTMEAFGLDWTSVVEEGELLGWVDRDAVKKAGGNELPPARPFSAYVLESSSLREALDSVVTSRTNVAVVVSHGQRYKGILSLERISREIIS